MNWDPGGASQNTSKLYVLMRFLRIEQTLFSLPMAYLGAFVVLRKVPSISVLILIFSALFFLRIAGMTNDNLADREIDSRNPRTRTRPLVTGVITVRDAKLLIIVGLAGFFISAYLVNIWAFLLSPFVALIVMTYPYMKRFTAFANYHLASIQGIAVFSGAVAALGLVYNSLLTILYYVPWLFVISTVFWALGFDLYNHIPDAEFDKQMNLHSFAVMLGPKALKFAGLNQIGSVTLAFLADYLYNLGPIGFVSTILHGAIMAYAYYLASRGDFGRAFYYNIYSSIVLGLGVDIDIALGIPFT
ncbi:4-hydroxybenzoate octaprenyltransferase [Sulfuracidifex metallicus]|uniref:4-hydroxybenzoate octaprenyltransferase n=1 Tax=Sulfuracidifex metallicus DSM 6482 = JCM 9184 TaxID=523847 RepID=A0A6A9QSI7_SULME|nr:4-hydroxybenzoate octaprenyltransferase [Sulfuracidifex metallicus]MUN28743.1 4-hydroxybenzoate octaprenyltransferase [Sulfuracidifex metallicus DSM 6482 = JCM 9184]WOE50739.1 4-hydroxybenzoate octaprenyltransferase [Sulfuracidifex metallicus DSM 6482 = JCM 9184]